MAEMCVPVTSQMVTVGEEGRGGDGVEFRACVTPKRPG